MNKKKKKNVGEKMIFYKFCVFNQILLRQLKKSINFVIRAPLLVLKKSTFVCSA